MLKPHAPGRCHPDASPDPDVDHNLQQQHPMSRAVPERHTCLTQEEETEPAGYDAETGRRLIKTPPPQTETDLGAAVPTVPQLSPPFRTSLCDPRPDRAHRTYSLLFPSDPTIRRSAGLVAVLAARPSSGMFRLTPGVDSVRQMGRTF